MSESTIVAEARASYPQERIWFVHQLAPKSGAYNVLINYLAPEHADVDTLRWAVARLIERHEVLRTVFVERDGGVFQLIKSQLSIDIPIEDISHLEEAERAGAIERITTEELRSPFDLESGPLIRCKVLRASPDQLTAIIAVHHIIADGWSVGVLTGDLDRLCADRLAGVDSTLAPLPIQYIDYSEWQRRRTAGRPLQAQLSYWLGQLKDAPPVIELPLDRPRTGSPDMAGKVKLFTVPRTVSSEISALAQRMNVTTFMVVVAAFKTLLHRMTNQTDIVVATVVANRTRVELEQMIGCFLNNLILRDHLKPEMSFEEAIAQVRDTTLDAYSNQDIPFEAVVEALNPPRSFSHNAVFQVMVAFQNFISDRFADLRLGDGDGGDNGISDTVVTSSGTAKFDMSLSMWEVGGTLGGAFEYRTDLFDDETIDRLIKHFKVLLADACQRPSAKLRELKLLDDREYDQIVHGWNSWKLDYPVDRCVHAMIEEQAQRTPDATAVIFGESSLTYRELNARANRIAHSLVKRGCRPERIVGIMLDQSLDMIVSILAVLKAGGAYLALDTEIPGERLSYIIGDAKPLVVVTQPQYVDRLVRAGAVPRVFDAQTGHDDEGAEANPAIEQSSRTLAYVLYTSGSTGTPKGVMVEHRSVLHHLWGMKLQYEFGPQDCFFQNHAYTFDVSVWEFFMPLVVGGRVVIAQPGGHKDPSYLVDEVVRNGVTFVCFLPSMLQLILDEPRVTEFNESPLRWVICGGETLSTEQVSRFFSKLTMRVDNAYGPTETTIHNTYYHCKSDALPAVIPIGAAMPGAKVYVLDPHLNPMPVGAPGEICIGGDAVGRGYLNSEKTTEEKFVRDPLSDDIDARLYKTGDIGRFLPDGNIIFLGRRDMQIKLRGFRIELGEITHTLKSHPAVSDCVTIVREDRPEDRRIVSYVVVQSANDMTSVLLQHLRDRLPEHMIPSALVQMERLPLKGSNKVDLAALPAPSDDALRSGKFVPPRTPDERKLAEIWKSLLGVEKVGAFDSFFNLGGHSLLVTRLLARVRTEMGAVLSIRQVFQTPLLGELADAIQSARESGEVEPDDEFMIQPRAVGARS